MTKTAQQLTFAVSFRTYRYTDLDLSDRAQYNQYRKSNSFATFNYSLMFVMYRGQWVLFSSRSTFVGPNHSIKLNNEAPYLERQFTEDRPSKIKNQPEQQFEIVMGYPRFPLRIPSKLGEPDAYGTKCPMKLVQQSRLLKSISDHVGEISRIHCHLRQSRVPA